MRKICKRARKRYKKSSCQSGSLLCPKGRFDMSAVAGNVSRRP